MRALDRESELFICNNSSNKMALVDLVLLDREGAHCSSCTMPALMQLDLLWVLEAFVVLRWIQS
jgi:hypothetical protein